MLDKHLKTLEEIVELKGNCLLARRCGNCPFASKCLPQFVIDGGKPLSQSARADLAAEVLLRAELLGEEDCASEQYHVQA